MAYMGSLMGILIIAYLIGAKVRDRRPFERASAALMTVSVVAMVLIMGLRIGSNEQVIASVGSIGLISALITVALWAGAMIPIYFTRKWMRLDREGRMAGNEDESKETRAGMLNVTGADALNEPGLPDAPKASDDKPEKQDSRFTCAILLSMLIGVLFGYFVLDRVLDEDGIRTFDSYSYGIMMAMLAIMVAAVGYSTGLEGKIIPELKRAGARVFVIPLALIAGTAITAVLIGILVPSLTVGESLAIAGGFGWYSYAPGIITASGHEIAGAISFLHNIFRELLGIALIPFVAKKIGALEAGALPGIAIMDIALPIYVRSTGSEIVAYAFAIGITEEIVTLLATPLIMGM